MDRRGNLSPYMRVMRAGLWLTLGEFCALYRRVYGVNATVMAKRLRVSPATLRKLERTATRLRSGGVSDALDSKVMGVNWRRLRYDGCSAEVLHSGIIFRVRTTMHDHPYGKMSLGNAAWLLRRRRGLRVVELASALGVTKQTILNREADRKDPRPNIAALAREEDYTQ